METSTRERRTDWIGSAKNVLRSYSYGLVHGLQKDAIQNGWDASPNKNKSYISASWSMTFEILKVETKKYLIIQDRGTTGLTGYKTANDYHDDEVPPEEERWAKWESFASGKTSEDSLGERGQGKSLYVLASKDYTLYYDSLREDGSYRAGWTQFTHSSSPLRHWDGEEGRNIIESLGIPMLKEQGSRFIIVNPDDEIVKSIKSGEFSEFIGETWWPLILKRGARINIKFDGETTTVEVPLRYPIGDDEDAKKTWHREQIEIKAYRNKEIYHIKSIALCYLPEEIKDEKNWGVGVYRGGMRVPTIQMARRDLRAHVYGYVELGEEIDKEIKRQDLEYPSHYDFKNEGLWNKIKYSIEDEIDAFVSQKLSGNLSDEQKKNNRRTSAQNRALALLRNITKGWPLATRGHGPGGGNDDDDTEKNIKKVGVRLSGFNFPNESNIPRLNYEDTISDYFIQGFNRTKEDIEIHYEIRILSGDRTILKVADEYETLVPHKTKILGDKHTLTATADLFPEPGEYRIKVTMYNASAKKKTELDSITRKIWVEEDPALTAPFDIKPRHFSELDSDIVSDKTEWFLSPIGSGKYELYYNLDHPSYLANEDDKLQPRYLVELFAQATLELLIKKVKNDGLQGMKTDNLPFDPEIIMSDDPAQAYKETMATLSKLRYELDEES